MALTTVRGSQRSLFVLWPMRPNGRHAPARLFNLHRHDRRTFALRPEIPPSEMPLGASPTSDAQDASRPFDPECPSEAGRPILRRLTATTWTPSRLEASP